MNANAVLFVHVGCGKCAFCKIFGPLVPVTIAPALQLPDGSLMVDHSKEEPVITLVMN